MKKRNLLAAALLITSLGVTSCSSNEEKKEKEQRMEESVEAEQERMEEESEELAERSDELAEEAERMEDMDPQEMQEAVPWADQQISLDRAKEVQEALKKNGHEIGSVDGLIGPKTSEGLQSFQEQHENLTASGELNQETIDALGLDFNLIQAQQEPKAEMSE